MHNHHFYDCHHCQCCSDNQFSFSYSYSETCRIPLDTTNIRHELENNHDINTVRLDCHGWDQSDDHISQMEEFVRNSATLREIKICIVDYSSTIDRLVQAADQNPLVRFHLNVHFSSSNLECVYNLLNKNRNNIKCLTLFGKAGLAKTEGYDILSTSLVSQSGLEHLTLSLDWLVHFPMPPFHLCSKLQTITIENVYKQQFLSEKVWALSWLDKIIAPNLRKISFNRFRFYTGKDLGLLMRRVFFQNLPYKPTLHLTSAMFDKEATQMLAYLLTENSAILRKVHLDSVNFDCDIDQMFGDMTTNQLHEALAQAESVPELSVKLGYRGNSFFNHSLFDRFHEETFFTTYKPIQKILANNRSLKRFSIQMMQDDGVYNRHAIKQVGQGIQMSSSLESLRLSMNQVVNVRPITDTLQTTTVTLKKLTLKFDAYVNVDGVHNQNVELLSTAMKNELFCLTFLKVTFGSSIKVHHGTIVKLVNAMSQSTSLTTFFLNCEKRMTLDMWKTIAKTLPKIQHVKNLKIITDRTDVNLSEIPESEQVEVQESLLDGVKDHETLISACFQLNNVELLPEAERHFSRKLRQACVHNFVAYLCKSISTSSGGAGPNTTTNNNENNDCEVPRNLLALLRLVEELCADVYYQDSLNQLRTSLLYTALRRRLTSQAMDALIDDFLGAGN